MLRKESASRWSEEARKGPLLEQIRQRFSEVGRGDLVSALLSAPPWGTKHPTESKTFQPFGDVYPNRTFAEPGPARQGVHGGRAMLRAVNPLNQPGKGWELRGLDDWQHAIGEGLARPKPTPTPARKLPTVNDNAILQHSGGGAIDRGHGANAMPDVIGPRAKRLILALTGAVALPPLAYGAYKAYERYRPQEAQERAKEATLARYGLRKEAIGDLGRNILIGAGVGGVLGAGTNYAFHHDKDDAGARALKAGLGGAVMGGIAGGVLTPEKKWAPSGGTSAPAGAADVAPKPPKDVRIQHERALEDAAGAQFARSAPTDPFGIKALRRDIDAGEAKARADEVRAATERAIRHAVSQGGQKGSSNPAFWDPEGWTAHLLSTLPTEHDKRVSQLQGASDGLQARIDAGKKLLNTPAHELPGFEEFDRQMRDPNHVFEF